MRSLSWTDDRAPPFGLGIAGTAAPMPAPGVRGGAPKLEGRPAAESAALTCGAAGGSCGGSESSTATGDAKIAVGLGMTFLTEPALALILRS